MCSWVDSSVPLNTVAMVLTWLNAPVKVSCLTEPRGFWGSPGCSSSKTFPLKQEIAIHAFLHYNRPSQTQKEASNFSAVHCYHCLLPHKCDGWCAVEQLGYVWLFLCCRDNSQKHKTLAEMIEEEHERRHIKTQKSVMLSVT